MKEIFKMGLSLFGKIIVINFMCFFLVISLSVLSNAVFTENIGYTAFGAKEGEEKTSQLYTYYFKDGEDTEKEKYEAEGYTITTSTIRSSISKTGNTVFLTVTQLFNIILLAGMIYPALWQRGTKDSNLVHFKHQPEDKLKGLKCGLIATVPSILLILVLTVLKSSATVSAFPSALLNMLLASTYSFNTLISMGAATLGDLSVLQMVLYIVLQFAVPLIAWAAYLLGYKNISLGEKFIYKKNKS